nr:hypothetical protein [Methanobrevibacter arboriphilus]
MAKSKLTDKIQEKIIIAIENGANFKDAAVYNGITEQTFYNWLKRGKESKKGKYKDFYEKMKEAKIKNKMFHIKNINVAGKKDWKASAWRLERMYPEEYARPEIQNNIEINNTNNQDNTKGSNDLNDFFKKQREIAIKKTTEEK